LALANQVPSIFFVICGTHRVFIMIIMVDKTIMPLVVIAFLKIILKELMKGYMRIEFLNSLIV